MSSEIPASVVFGLLLWLNLWGAEALDIRLYVRKYAQVKQSKIKKSHTNYIQKVQTFALILSLSVTLTQMKNYMLLLLYTMESCLCHPKQYLFLSEFLRLWLYGTIFYFFFTNTSELTHNSERIKFCSFPNHNTVYGNL